MKEEITIEVAPEESPTSDRDLLVEIARIAKRIGDLSHTDTDKYLDLQVAAFERWHKVSEKTKNQLGKLKTGPWGKSVADCVTVLFGKGQCNQNDGKTAAGLLKQALELEELEPWGSVTRSGTLTTVSNALPPSERDPLVIDRPQGRQQQRSRRCPCFLTTACIEARGLPDDCEELTILRGFRDEYVLALPGGEEIVAEYYRIAPGIVAGIHQRSNARGALEDLYTNLVVRCVDLIQRTQNEEALETYIAWVRQLRAEYP